MRACKICEKPMNSLEDLARELVRLEADLAAVPAQGDETLRGDVVDYLAEEVRPRLLYTAAELLGVHYECRVQEAVRSGHAVEVPPAARGEA